MNSVSIVLLCLILAAAFVGLSTSGRQPGSRGLALFPYFLFFQFAYQLTASLYSFVFTQHASNHFIFNFSIPVNLLFFGFLYFDFVHNRTKRKVIIVCTVLNLIFFVINLAFIQGSSFLMTYSRTAMAFSLVTFSLLYFHELITEEEDETYRANPARSAPFWIVTAIFTFYLCSTFAIIFWKFLVFKNESFGPVMLRILAFLLYGMYIVGLLLHRPPGQNPRD